MTREEIIKASQKYVKLTVREREVLCGLYTDIQKAFLAGAEFVQEHPINVWHDASEEPQGNNWHILCQNEMNGYCLESRVFMLNDPWKEFVEEEMIAKWAYVNDLLPKGGKK